MINCLEISCLKACAYRARSVEKGRPAVASVAISCEDLHFFDKGGIRVGEDVALVSPPRELPGT